MFSRYSKRLYLNIAAQDNSFYRYSSKDNGNEGIKVNYKRKLSTEYISMELNKVMIFNL